MNLLLLEDQKTGRDSLKRIVAEINVNIRVTAATSIPDLIKKLCTEVFDLAILDVDLRAWSPGTNRTPLFAEEEVIMDGYDVARIVRGFNSKIEETNVLLYSGFEKDNARAGNYRYLAKGASNTTDIFEDIEREMGNIITRPEDIRLEPDTEEFSNFIKPRKIRYYKELLSKVNSSQRFRYAGAHSWMSNLNSKEDRRYAGPLLRSSGSGSDREFLLNAEIEVCGNEKLPSLVEEKKKIPHVFWNYSDPDFFEQQFDQYRSIREKSEDLDISFNICYSASMADHLLSTKSEQGSIDKPLSLLSGNGEDIIVDTQLNLIRKMATAGSGQAEIQDLIGRVAKKTKYEVLDVFEGKLVEYDVEADSALVSIQSVVERGEATKEEFSYDRLKKAGVPFEGSKFLFYVTESTGKASISNTIEPL